MNKLMGSVRSQQELMDGYDVEHIKYGWYMAEEHPIINDVIRSIYRVYKYEKPNVGKQVKVYKFGYPDYKSMLKKHPELK